MAETNRPKVRVQKISTRSGQPLQKPSKKKGKGGGLCGVIIAIAVIAIIATIFSSHSNAAPPAPDSNATATAQAVAQQWNVDYAATTDAEAQTALSLPTASPTRKPRPTHLATPRPTTKPTQAPTCQAVNNNPCCYNFSSGNLIYNPPSNFCDYFNCIASFWNGSGFVNECVDGSYSLSGGHSGDCSHHGGEWRPLYSH